MNTTSDVYVKNVLISVSDKTGIGEFGRFLHHQGVRIFSTDGTGKLLLEEGVAVMDIADYVDCPELMDGRVKTLHSRIYAGILAQRDNKNHCFMMEAHGVEPIDMVIVNLYPFEKTVKKGSPPHECIENIDIGGVGLIRAAAKNCAHVVAVVDPEDYIKVMDELSVKGRISGRLSFFLAMKAFSYIADYDVAIRDWFHSTLEDDGSMPSHLSLSASLHEVLRYGENPHQKGAIYRVDHSPLPLISSLLLQGKKLSYNNIQDADAAFGLLTDLMDQPSAAIIKHAAPCGVASSVDGVCHAFQKALACDPLSSFGGIIAVNDTVGVELASLVKDLFIELLIAPDFTEEALEILAIRKSLSLLKIPREVWLRVAAEGRGLCFKTVMGGVLLQTSDHTKIDIERCRVVTHRQPSDSEWRDMLFADKIVKHLYSNAIACVHEGASIGLGGGFTSRVHAAESAVKHMKSLGVLQGVAASDAFFPFEDGLKVLVDAGITAVIQPGGSRNDSIIIDFADAHGISMVFTGVRRFKH